MRPNLTALAVLTLAPLAALSTLTGCEEKKPATPAAPAPAKPAPATPKADDHGHDHGPSGEHTSEKAPGHGGGVIDLLATGANTVGPFNITKASRDKGDIVAGKDAAFDVTIEPKDAAGPKATAVRFWIGTEDGKGSVKAKAEIEDPKDPNRWHVHAEVPNPIPAGSKFFFEIEDDKGGKHVSSFDLKM
jgi:hypothetical protein